MKNLHKAEVNKARALIKIDSLSRELSAQKDAKQLQNELLQWYERNKTNPDNPIFIFIEIYNLLGDKGYPAVPGKKIKYKWDLVSTNILFQSPKIEDELLGAFRGKHDIELNEIDSKEVFGKYPMLCVFIHELLHLFSFLAFNSTMPKPYKEWEELLGLLKEDFKKHKKIPEKYCVLNYFDEKYFKEKFDKSNLSIEIPSRLAEFLIENNSLPNDPTILSPETIEKIRETFAKFCVLMRAFKNRILQIQETSHLPGKLKLYELAKNGKRSEFLALRAINPRRYGMFPDHWSFFQTPKDLEEKDFPLKSRERFGKTPLEIAFKQGRINTVIILLEKIRKSGDKLSSYMEVNLKGPQGRTLLTEAIYYNSQQNIEELIVWLVKDNKASIDVLEKSPSEEARLRVFASCSDHCAFNQRISKPLRFLILNHMTIHDDPIVNQKLIDQFKKKIIWLPNIEPIHNQEDENIEDLEDIDEDKDSEDSSPRSFAQLQV